ncbi:hypothetical protein LTS08_004287 [Lithohypha guttulata]|nr:hypothetical protein LTS08_004287 [Lithohypha guttulata]
MAAARVQLKAIEKSPTTIQYHVRGPKAKERPQYIKKFYPNADAQHTLSQPWLAATDPAMPPYPYNKNRHFEEANHGLYGGATIQSGNKISDGRNKGKTLRKWYPNVRVEKLQSKALNVEMNLPCTARVSRTIAKCGGLDEYLLGEKPARLKELGMLGWKLRWLVLKSEAMKKKHEKQREKLGLTKASGVNATFAEAWQDPVVRSSILEKMVVGWQQLKTKDDKFQKHLKHTLRWEEKLKPIRSLDVYDPVKFELPVDVVEEEPTKRGQLPPVQTGFGIIQVQNKQGEWKGIESRSGQGLKSLEEVTTANEAEAGEDFLHGHVPQASDVVDIEQPPPAMPA